MALGQRTYTYVDLGYKKLDLTRESKNSLPSEAGLDASLRGLFKRIFGKSTVMQAGM